MADAILIPGLGELVFDDDCDWHVSDPVPVPVLGGAQCQFVVEGYQDDAAPEDFHAAVAAFLALDPSALTSAAPTSTPTTATSRATWPTRAA